MSAFIGPSDSHSKFVGYGWTAVKKGILIMILIYFVEKKPRFSFKYRFHIRMFPKDCILMCVSLVVQGKGREKGIKGREYGKNQKRVKMP